MTRRFGIVQPASQLARAWGSYPGREDPYSQCSGLVERLTSRGRLPLSVLMPVTMPVSYLGLALAALGRQRVSLDIWEVVVASDARTPGVAGIASDVSELFGLRVTVVQVENVAGSPAVLLNAAAEAARGHILVLLEPDRMACPDLVSGHLSCHLAGDRIGIGAEPWKMQTHLYPTFEPVLSECPPRPMVSWQDLARGEDWLDLATCNARDHGALFTWARGTGRSLPGAWRFVSAGNASVSAAAFHRAGGFDRWCCSWQTAQVEFARRLIATGSEVVFAGYALAVRQLVPPPMPA